MSKSWYEIKNLAESETEIFIYDEIGVFGIDANTFINDLRSVTTPKIILHINSPGGAVFDGLAIFNALASHSSFIEARIDSVAASIASIFPLACDEAVIAENAFVMIHNASGVAFGDAKEMVRVSQLLEKVQNSIVQTYVKNTSLSEKQALEFMAETKWFNAEEAKEHGFADRIGQDEKVNAKFDLSIFNNVPDGVQQVHKEQPSDIRDFEKNLRDSGYSRSEAVSIAACAFKYVPANQSDSDICLSDSGNALLKSIKKLNKTITA